MRDKIRPYAVAMALTKIATGTRWDLALPKITSAVKFVGAGCFRDVGFRNNRKRRRA
jgi:hypothetical protein